MIVNAKRNKKIKITAYVREGEIVDQLKKKFLYNLAKTAYNSENFTGKI